MKKKLPALLLCLCLAAQLAACDQPVSQGTEFLPPEGSPEASVPAPTNTPAPTPDQTPVPTSTPTPDPTPTPSPEPGSGVVVLHELEDAQLYLEEGRLRLRKGEHDGPLPAGADGFSDGFLPEQYHGADEAHVLLAGNSVGIFYDLYVAWSGSGWTEYRPETVPLSEILDAGQQELYREAQELYMHMYAGSTYEGIDNLPGGEGRPESDPAEWKHNGWTYLEVRGYYADWKVFARDIHRCFTDRWWNEFNDVEDGIPIYIDHNGRLYALGVEMSGGNYNGEYFPDTYRLLNRTEDTIEFAAIGHYSERYPLNGETIEDRDHRWETSYDYTMEFLIRLVLTQDGWRFDRFSAPACVRDQNRVETAYYSKRL